MLIRLVSSISYIVLPPVFSWWLSTCMRSVTVSILSVHANVSLLLSVYDWTAAGTFNEKIKVPFIAWGFVGLLASDLLVFFTTSYWRERIYALFVGTHVVCVILLLGSVRFRSYSARVLGN